MRRCFAMWIRIKALLRLSRPAAPPPPPTLILGTVATTGADELARRERLRRIHGSEPSWIDRPERDRLRRDLRSYQHEDP